jgi:hypothetical protein
VRELRIHRRAAGILALGGVMEHPEHGRHVVERLLACALRRGRLVADGPERDRRVVVLLSNQLDQLHANVLDRFCGRRSRRALVRRRTQAGRALGPRDQAELVDSP